MECAHAFTDEEILVGAVDVWEQAVMTPDDVVYMLTKAEGIRWEVLTAIGLVDVSTYHVRLSGCVGWWIQCVHEPPSALPHPPPRRCVVLLDQPIPNVLEALKKTEEWIGRISEMDETELNALLDRNTREVSDGMRTL